MIYSILLTIMKYKMNQHIFLVIFYFIFTAWCDTKMIAYNRPGSYLLTPEDYEQNTNEKSSLIFEMWGAGGGGMNPCSDSCNDVPPCGANGASEKSPIFGTPVHTGGGAGAYVKIYSTGYNITYNITVGEGGAAGNCVSIFDGYNSSVQRYINGESGGDTTIYINSHGKQYIYAEASGGFRGGVGYGGFGYGGFGSFSNHGEEIFTIDGGNAYFSYDPYHKIVMSHGGNSPNGGEGGTEFYYDTNFTYMDSEDGKFPGGGGSGFCANIADLMRNNTATAGDGANGAVIVYFTVKDKPSNNVTPSTAPVGTTTSGSASAVLLALIFLGCGLTIFMVTYFTCANKNKIPNNNDCELVEIKHEKPDK